MAIRSLSQIISDAVTYITTKRPTVATFTGSVVRDVVVESPAQEFDRLYQELSRTQKLQSLNYASEMTTEELNDLAANYGLTRLAGSTAVGTITFQVRVFTPTSSPIVVTTGAVVGTTGEQDTSLITFVTTQAVTMNPALASSYFNPATGLYEITAEIEAQTAGIVGNVPAGTITDLLTSIAGVDFIVNTVATTGGSDEESNEALAARIQAKLSGNNVGTRTGIESLVRENTNVRDVQVVTPNDLEMMRNEFGGAVDIYILGQVIASASEIYRYSATGSQEFILIRQPAKSITNITGIVTGTPYTFIEGTDFEFVADTSTLYNGSTRLQNKVVFNIGGVNPDDGTTITIAYTYDKLIQDLQNVLDANENHIVTSDILVKESIQATIDITVQISLFPGYPSTTAITDSQTALSTYINNLELGDSINRSDIVGILEQIPSIDQVNLDTMVLIKNGIPIPQSQQRLSIAKYEYPRVSTITVVVI